MLRLLASNAALRKLVAPGERRMGACRADDGTITRRVEMALQKRSVGSASLVVTTEERIVRLTGALCSQAFIDKAAGIARAIAGVLSVRNELRLLPN
jgi:osmotically-inducible protein OsmY